MWTTSAAYGSMGIMPQLVAERAVYLRERSDGLYTPATYLASELAGQRGRRRGCGVRWQAVGGTAGCGWQGSLQPDLLMSRPHPSPLFIFHPCQPQAYKLLEELGVSLGVSLPYAIAVWFIVDLQGSLALFWLVGAATTAIAIGAQRGWRA